MKTQVSILGACLLLSLVRCGSDDGASPGDSNGDGATLVQTTTVGPEGGTLEGGDFRMIVPAGALTAEKELRLYREEARDPFDGAWVTETYRVEGVPADHAEPIEFRVRHDGTATDSCWIAIGEEAGVPIDGSTTPVYFLYEAVDSGGVLVSSLPPIESGVTKSAVADPPDMILWVLGLTDLTRRHSLNGYFTIHCPLEAGGLFPQLPEFCTAAYDSFGTIDLYLDEHLYPVDAPVVMLPAAYADRYSLFLAARPGKSAVFLNQEKASLTDTETAMWFRVTIGRDYMHRIACAHDPAYFLADHSINPATQWLHVATSTASESFMALGQTHVPRDYEAHKHDYGSAPLRGLQAGAGATTNSAWEHGVGMSPFIRYLANHYGWRVLERIYANVESGDAPVDAIANSVADPPHVWWTEFLAEYFHGDLYGNGSSNYGYWVEDDLHVTEPKDQTWKRTASYPDLSAKIYQIKLDMDALGANDSLVLGSTMKNPEAEPGDVAILLFGEDGAFNPRVTPLANLTISSLANSTDHNGIFYAVVVNRFADAPYTGTSEIEFTVEYDATDPPLAFNHCEVTGRVIAMVSDSYGASAEEEVENTNYCCRADGAFQGNTFDVTYHRTYGGGNQISRGRVRVVVDRAANEIAEFVAVDTTTFLSSDAVYYSKLTGGGVPFEGEHGGVRYYRVTGDATNDALTDFRYRVETPTFWEESSIWYCGPNSRVTVILSNN